MKKPLRVLYVLNSAGAGATQGILELLVGLPADRYQSFAVLPAAPDDLQRENLSRLTEAFRVVPMAWWNSKTHLPPWHRLRVWGAGQARTAGRLKSVWQLARLIRAWKIDLVYTNTAMMLDGALAAWLTGRPHLWHIKEWVGRRARTHFVLPDPLLARFFIALSDRVLVMSRFIGELFSHCGLPDRVLIVNDAVDANKFTGDLNRRKLRFSLGVSDEDLLIGMVASLTSTWKRHALFIEMASLLAVRFPNVRFAIFGPEPNQQVNSAYNQPWDYYQSLKQQVYQRGLDGRFIWAGYYGDIPQMMDAIDVLVHPCEIEPFGRIAIEAMAAGRPVVGPSRGGIAESVIDGETGFLVPAGNAQAFAAATARLVTNAHLRRRMGTAGRAHAAANFSIEQHVERMAGIYDEVVRSRGRA